VSAGPNAAAELTAIWPANLDACQARPLQRSAESQE
jgi:hypothetical protein